MKWNIFKIGIIPFTELIFLHQIEEKLLNFRLYHIHEIDKKEKFQIFILVNECFNNFLIMLYSLNVFKSETIFYKIRKNIPLLGLPKYMWVNLAVCVSNTDIYPNIYKNNIS